MKSYAPKLYRGTSAKGSGWYTSKTVMKVVDAPKGTFDMWLQRDIARPTVPSRKQGVASKWHLESIVALVLTLELGEIGMALTAAADIACGIVEMEEVFRALSAFDDSDEDYQYSKFAVNTRTKKWVGTNKISEWPDSYELGEDIWITFDLAPRVIRTSEKLKEVLDND